MSSMDFTGSIEMAEGGRQDRRAVSRAHRGRELPLVSLPLGREAVVTRIDSADPECVNRLASLGILPGSRISLARRGMVFLATLDRYQVAFDDAVARAVWVDDENCP